jgi:hypothetical protein
MVLIPVYEDPADAESSPFALPNTDPFTWQWLSTINRVNSQVQKVCTGCFPLIFGYAGLILCARLSSFRM